MSNLFKSNSRFASLADDISSDKKGKKEKNVKNVNEVIKDNEVVNNRFNSFKDEQPFRELNFRDDRRNNFRTRDDEKEKLKRQQERDNIKELQEKEKEANININININVNNFPELIKSEKKEITKAKQISFADKLKKGEVIITNNNNTKDPELENLPYGWAILKRDPLTGNTIIKKHPEKSKPEISEKENGKAILKALVELHEKRTKEYIDTYGEYTWEKMFKRPNWSEEELENMSDSDSDYDDETEENNSYDDEDYY